MKEKVRQQVEALKSEVDNFDKSYSDRLNEINKDIQILVTKTDILTTNWKGKWHSPEYDVYQDISSKTEKNYRYTYENIFDYIGKETTVDFKGIGEEMKNIVKESRLLNENISTEMSMVRGVELFANQQEIIKNIAEFEWGFLATKFIDNVRPKYGMYDYKTAQKLLNEGYSTPPHIAYGANLMSLASEVMAVQDNIKLHKRLLREIELIVGDTKGSNVTASAIDLIENLVNKFHIVARQLVNRHNKRDTIIITDEYDTQDLLNGLLRIHFDDVRPEDYTPSYAGRNTRVDFLLKKERIIIEVKKTRSTLKDKEVGDELLQDIARYKNHPDCDTLCCFVYDPQGLIKNPRGLEADLNSESSEKIRVIVLIRP